MRKMKNRIDLKSHSLENLSAWVVDCIESDATADEIYATILKLFSNKIFSIEHV